MKKTKLLIITAVVLTITGGAVFAGKKFKGNNDYSEKAIPADNIIKQNLVNSIYLSGVIDGKKTAIKSPFSFEIKKVNVEVGEWVEKGDILFSFDSSELEDNYNKLVKRLETEKNKSDYEHQNNIDSMDFLETEKNKMLEYEQSKIDSMYTMKDEINQRIANNNSELETINNESAIIDEKLKNLDTASEEYNNLKIQYDKNVNRIHEINSENETLTIQLLEVESNIDLAMKSYDQVEIEYEKMIDKAQYAIDMEEYQMYSVDSSEIEKLENQIEECCIKAPMSGVITELNVVEGMSPTDINLAYIVSDSDLYISAMVSEDKVYKISKDMPVTIKCLSTGDTEYNGSISYISKTANQQGSSIRTSYDIKIDFNKKNIPENLFVGMTSSVNVILDKKDDVYTVPYDCIIEEDGNKYIMTAEKAGDSYKVRKTEITTGTEADYYTEISFEGISENIIFITEPLSVNDGDVINIDIA